MERRYTKMYNKKISADGYGCKKEEIFQTILQAK